MTLCPNCGAEDSLRQAVEVRSQATRKVRVALEKGKPKVSYGDLDHGVFPELEDEHEIECEKCRETWVSAAALVSGTPVEYRCDGCDWWGSNHWQHSIERPDCTGTLERGDGLAVPA